MEFEPLAGALGVYPVTVDNQAIDGIYLSNYNKEAIKFRLSFSADRMGATGFTDIINQKQYRTASNGAMRTLDFEMGGRQAIVLFQNG